MQRQLAGDEHRGVDAANPSGKLDEVAHGLAAAHNAHVAQILLGGRQAAAQQLQQVLLLGQGLPVFQLHQLQGGADVIETRQIPEIGDAAHISAGLPVVHRGGGDQDLIAAGGVADDLGEGLLAFPHSDGHLRHRVAQLHKVVYVFALDLLGGEAGEAEVGLVGEDDAARLVGVGDAILGGGKNGVDNAVADECVEFIPGHGHPLLCAARCRRALLL